MCSNCGDSVNSRASLGKNSQKKTPTFLWALPKLAKLIFTFKKSVKIIFANLGNAQRRVGFFLGSLP